MRHLLNLLLMLIVAVADCHADTKRVYVLPIDEEIGSSSWLHTSNALKEAEAYHADLIVLHLNTYGGTLQHADSMRTALLHCPVPTVAFVDNNAASAGALIALACDSVFMRPDASMGAATVVNGEDGTALPDKYQSYMRAMMRATAERHGKVDGRWRRDPLIAEAMVDSRVVVPGLIDSTRVLTMTPEEALKWGYADGKAESIDQVLSQLNIDDYHVRNYRPTWVENLLGILTNPAVQSILIMLILGGIYFELQTPGMGFPTVVAVTAAALYFMPLYLIGIVSSWIVLMCVAGIVLLLLEIFVFPGFGVAGIAGAVLTLGAIFIGLLESFSLPLPDSESVAHADNAMLKAIVTMVVSVALTIGAVFWLTSRYAPRWVNRRMELHKVLSDKEGYIGVDTTPRALIGHQGVAVTDLRPSGKVSIKGTHYDAVSLNGDYIIAGLQVKVVKFENAQIYVVPLG